jgi:hypothetical protein
MRETEARSLAFAGRRRKASETFAQAAAMADGRGLHAEKVRILANDANMNAVFGLTGLAEKQITVAEKLVEKEAVPPEALQPSLIGQLDSPALAWTLALCGEADRANALSESLAQKLPLDSLSNSVWVPVVRATLELNRASVEGANAAVQLLQPAREYEAATFFRPVWVRAQAQLQSKNGELASQEFQKIIDHRGWDVVSPLWPLAHLGLARALALQGDIAKSREAYERFFFLWKDADSDLPVLITARREYDKVK